MDDGRPLTDDVVGDFDVIAELLSSARYVDWLLWFTLKAFEE